MKTIAAKELSLKLGEGASYTILDVREPYERSICKIEALHIPMGDIIDRIKDVPSNEKVVVMCRTGKRAEAVVNLLEQKYQYQNLILLEGGLMAWIDEVAPHLEKY